jgi:hypothetical protein
MKTFLTTIATLFASIAFCQNTPIVVLNELNMDNPGGPDQSEFVELYGAPGTPLDSLVIVFFEGNGDLSYEAFDLDGFMLDNNGFFVIGNAAAANVDFIIPDGTISNGADGVAIYSGDATDFPTDTPPTTVNLIDAAVYETGDQTDAGLIAALGLDVAVPGYVQLDETAQQNGADLSISRIPDGGVSFDFGAWTLQEITPGTFNVPQCFASAITLSDGSSSISLCSGAIESIITLQTDSLSFGETQFYVVTSTNDTIQAVSTDSIIDFSSFAEGAYLIYTVFYNGTLDSTTIANELPLTGITAGNCVSISSNSVSVNVVPCTGCVGGDISSNLGSGSSYCSSSIPQFSFSTTSTSQEDTYLFLLSDANGAIVDTFSTTYDASNLAPGTYTVQGISFIGGLSGLDSLTTLSASTCMELSINSISFNLLNCPYIVFNEINIDNPGGGDTEEFIEFLGTPNASLDGLVLVLFEGGNDLSYEAFDLDGYSLDENGFFVIGNAAVVNVDFVIPDATISNGPDGLGLYIGNDTDFPTDTPPTTLNLIEAAVYETGDQPDDALIAALGLDIAVPGYTQLDETSQQNNPDFSLSRYPDGGAPYNFSPFVLQDVTPGTWNQPQCLGGTILSSGTTQFCNTESSMTVSWSIDGTGYGDQLLFVITDSNDTIINTTSDTTYDFAGTAIGSYSVYSVYYNGTLDSTTVNAGNILSGITAGNCVSTSTNFISVTIVPCSGCIVGEVSISGDALQFCNSASSVIAMSNTGTSLDDSYVYVMTDNGGTIAATATSEFSINGFAAGSYQIYGVSYQGNITGLDAGSALSAITSDGCFEISSNGVAIEIFDCHDNTPCEQLFFSEYLEGTNGTKALELFNPSLETIDLTGYTILQYANGGATPSDILDLTGTIAPFGTYVIANPGQGGGGGAASQTVLGLADLTDQIANFNGNDALELRYNGTLIDAIGIVGDNPGTGNGWPVANTSTVDVDMVRQFDIQSPMPIWAISANQWDIYGNTDYTHLGNHFFQPCTDDLLAGFVSGDITVAENVGTLTINVQCLNAADTITITASLVGGTADGTDYTVTLPATLNFNDSNALQSFTLDIINDANAEGAETIILTLSSDSAITWLQQTITITITQSDPNCDGGNLFGAGQGPIAQCSDLPNAPLDLVGNNNTTGDTYVFVITDAADQILEIVTSAPVSLDAYGEGTFHVWGLSYTGNIDSTTIATGMPVEGINADQCAELSGNFATVERTPCIIVGCDAGDVLISDGAEFITICNGDNHIDVGLTNTGQSIDANYTYFITDAAGNIVDQTDSIWNGASAAEGTYYIYGVSYLNSLIDSTIAEGMPFSGILADECLEVSGNFVEAVVFVCSGVAPCSQLFFSEIIEDSQSDKSIEIYNPASFPVDLSNYTINLYANGAVAPTASVTLSGTLSAQSVYVVTSSGNGQNPTDQAILDVTDITSDVAVFTGNDAIELQYQGTAVDIVGIIGDDPGGNGWEFGNSSTANHVLVRRQEVTSGSTDWNLVSGQWISYDPTDFSHLGSHDAYDCGFVPQAIVGFTTAAQTVPEINGTLITVTIHTESVETPFQLLIDETGAGTATFGSDYSAAFPITLTVPIGNNDLSFQMTVLGDAVTEGDETINLSLTANANVYFNAPTQVITISENLGLVTVESPLVTCFPNPFSDQIQVNASTAIESLRITDMSGRTIVYTLNNTHEKSVLLNTSALAVGSYLLVLETADGQVRQPLQKVN